MLDILKEQVATVTKETECLGMCRRKSGNFSIYDPETGYVVIMPNGVARDVPGPEHVCVMDPSGKVIERAAEVKPSSKVMIHLYTYKERKGTRTVVYTHARYSIAFSVMNKPIMPIVYEYAYLGKTGTAPMAFYKWAGTVDLAKKVAEVMKEYDRCLMENHGAITTDKDMDTTFLKAQYAEETAEMYYITLAVGNGVGPHAPSVEKLQKWAYPKEITLQKDLGGSMKKIVNAPEVYMDGMLHGIYTTHPDMLRYVEDDLRCYCTAKKKQGEVVTIIGGGTRYLPLLLGYVSENLLDGRGIDSVFQPSSSGQLYNVAKEAETGAGVLFLYGNYTGGIMSFDMVAEMLDTGNVRTASIVRADDVLSNEDAQTRRGVTGVFFTYRCAGAMAIRVGTLEEVLDVARKTEENTRTAGFALTPCIIPGIGHFNFTLVKDEMAFGMGIHSEPGVWGGPVRTANDLAEESMREILGGMPLNPGEGAYLLINSPGATNWEELYTLSGSVHCILEERGIRVYRTFVGEYATSTEMAGASISVCRMADQGMKQWIDMPVHMPSYTQV